MKNIISYVSESKKRKDVFTPTQEDVKIISKLFTKTGFDTWECSDLAKKYNHKNPLIRLWLAIMFESNSIPYIDGNNVNSYPGNFGKELIDRALKYGATKEEFIDVYNSHKDGEFHKIPKTFESEIHQKIQVLFDNLLGKGEYGYSLKYNDEKNYSDKAKELLGKRNGIVVIPFELNSNKLNKILNCEIAFVGSSYYHYRVEDKNFTYSKQFYEEIQKYM